MQFIAVQFIIFSSKGRLGSKNESHCHKFFVPTPASTENCFSFAINFVRSTDPIKKYARTTSSNGYSIYYFSNQDCYQTTRKKKQLNLFKKIDSCQKLEIIISVVY
jgi:hypothetical protein